MIYFDFGLPTRFANTAKVQSVSVVDEGFDILNQGADDLRPHVM